MSEKFCKDCPCYLPRKRTDNIDYDGDCRFNPPTFKPDKDSQPAFWWSFSRVYMDDWCYTGRQIMEKQS
jgi:hypothetical protein